MGRSRRGVRSASPNRSSNSGRPEARRHGQAGGTDGRAEDAALGRREPGSVGRGRLTPRSDRGCASSAPPRSRADHRARDHDVERGDDGVRLSDGRPVDARLMDALERDDRGRADRLARRSRRGRSRPRRQVAPTSPPPDARHDGAGAGGRRGGKEPRRVRRGAAVASSVGSGRVTASDPVAAGLMRTGRACRTAGRAAPTSRRGPPAARSGPRA